MHFATITLAAVALSTTSHAASSRRDPSGPFGGDFAFFGGHPDIKPRDATLDARHADSSLMIMDAGIRNLPECYRSCMYSEQDKYHSLDDITVGQFCDADRQVVLNWIATDVTACAVDCLNRNKREVNSWYNTTCG